MKLYKTVKPFTVDASKFAKAKHDLKKIKIVKGDLFKASVLDGGKVKLELYHPCCKSIWYIEASREELEDYFEEVSEENAT